MFPGLYIIQQGKEIPPTLLAQAFDRAFVPALLGAFPEASDRIGPSYAATQSRCKDTLGQFHIPICELPGAVLPTFARLLFRFLGELSWGKSAFFLHELRGTKGRSTHTASVPETITAAHQLYFQNINMDAIEQDRTQWVADIGNEIRVKGQVVLWASNNHGGLIRKALPKLNARLRASLMSAELYQRHPTAGLSDVAGFSLRPGSLGSEDKVAYVQCYTTEKNMVYQLHEGIFDKHRPSELAPGNIDRLIKNVGEATMMMKRCMDGGQEGCARMEVRVPVLDCEEYLRGLEHELVQQSVVVVPSELWW